MSTRIDIKSSGGGSTPVGATLQKTGQTTSYRTGDDADTRNEGRATDFFTLATNNPFGNTNRFTDELGGQTYANNITIDWSTYDTIAGTVMGVYTVDALASDWNDAIDSALAVSVGTFTTGWRLPNRYELITLACFESSSASYFLNYTQLGITSGGRIYWCSTTNIRNTSTAYNFRTSSGDFANSFKTGSGGYWFAVRTFTVSGTTLT